MRDDPNWFAMHDLAPTSVQIAMELQMLRFARDQYATFIKLIERAFNYSANLMARDKNITNGLSEDALTTLLLRPFQAMGFLASHDTNVGGHCDIVVESREMLWLGEAKKSGSYTDLLHGFRQLADRYATGLPDQDHSGMIIYMQSANARHTLEEWRAYLKQVEPDADVSEIENLRFTSITMHKGTGLPFTTLHVTVATFHNPTDTQPAPERDRQWRSANAA